jgi:TonB family protein
MPQRTYYLFFLLGALVSSAAAQGDTWLEVHTPHFTVVSNSPEKDARRVSRQFERMQAVLVRVFPEAGLDSAAPITVFAVQDKRTLETLEPTVYLGKGQLNLVGLFLHSPENNYVLLLMNAPGLHPYSTIYHEYTHFVLNRTGQWMPLWLSEGLAQYYQTTEIFDDKVHFGKLDPYVMNLLQRNQPLPLTTLLAVDQHSPYYHEEDKGSVFYSESWLLTHYLKTRDDLEGTHRVLDYLDLLHQGGNPVTAATQAFGDLDTLQTDLRTYIAKGNYGSQDINGSTDADESSFEVRALSQVESSNLRAEFLAHDQRESDARALLQDVMREDPTNVRARETMALISIRLGNFDEARKWGEQAIKLKPESFFANYLVGVAGVRKSPSDPAAKARVAESVRAALRLNPSFAPAYDLQGILLGLQGNRDGEAHRLIQKSIEMDPSAIGFRVDDANVLMQMNRPQEAIETLELALKMAHTSEETASVESVLGAAHKFQTERSKILHQNASHLPAQPAPTTAQSTGASGTVPPRPISQVQPGYTEEARSAKRQGVCVLAMIIGIDGKPSNIVVTKKLGLGLDEQAIAAVRKWQFEPARSNGKPVLARFTVHMAFNIFGDDDKILDLSQKARSGDPSAEFELANEFFEGKLIPKDEDQGMALLQRAALHGLPQAQFQMGERTYGDGTNSASFADAYIWYMLAKRGGIDESDMKTNELEQKMSPEELAENKKRLENWTPQQVK